MLGHLSFSDGRIRHVAKKMRIASFLVLKAAKSLSGSLKWMIKGKG
jgi:hypothetical protein